MGGDSEPERQDGLGRTSGGLVHSSQNGGQRQDQEQGVDAVQKTPEPGQPGTGVLDACGALDKGLQKIAQDPAQTDGDHQARRDVTQQGKNERRSDDGSHQPTERLGW